MPPKAAAKEPKAPAKDRDITQDQLLYAIILQVGLPSGGEAWAQVAARLPDTPDGAARHRWNRLKAKWDGNTLFGERHFEIIDEAEELRGRPKKEKKKAEAGMKKTNAKGKGKGKAVEVKETVVEDQDEDGVGADEQSDQDDGGEGSSRVAAAVKKKKEKLIKQPMEPARAFEEESGDDMAVESEV